MTIGNRIDNSYLLSNRRFVIVVIVLLIIFFTFMTLFYLKGEELSRHPCSICAEVNGFPIMCYAPGLNPISQRFDPNGSVTYDGTLD